MSRSTISIRIIFLLQSLTLLSNPALATHDTPAPITQETVKEGKVDAFHNDWSNKVLRMANKLDGLFGDERIEEDAQQTRATVRLDMRAEDGQSVDFRGRISARLSLPNLENKWAVIINGENEDEQFSAVDDENTEDDRSLALRYSSISSLTRNLSFDAGVRRPDGKYELFVRGRLRNTRPVSNWLNRMDHRLYYYYSFGAEYDGFMDFDRALPPSLLFRSRTRLRWWESDKKCNGGICPEQHFTLFQRMKSNKHALAYESSTFFQTRPFEGSREDDNSVSSGEVVSETLLRLRYRRKTRWNWAYVELRPEVVFPRYNNYDATWRMMLRFEGIFGYKPSIESLEFGPEKTLSNG